MKEWELTVPGCQALQDTAVSSWSPPAGRPHSDTERLWIFPLGVLPPTPRGGGGGGGGGESL